ncbi:hypothetical protein [Bartonella sp. TT110JLCBS]
MLSFLGGKLEGKAWRATWGQLGREELCGDFLSQYGKGGMKKKAYI